MELKSKLNEMYAIMQKSYPDERPSEIYGRIADELDRILAVRQYNSFAAEAMSTEDFQKVKDFAVNEFFARQTQADKEIIASAYARIERGTVGRYDLRTIMDFWKEARAAWSKRRGRD